MTAMRLTVRHETHYEYHEMLHYSVQRYYLTPLAYAAQRIIEWRIIAPGIANALHYQDGFGNYVHLATATRVNSPFSIIAEGIVEVADAAGVVKGLYCPASDLIFLRQTAYTMPDATMISMAEDLQRQTKSPLELAHKLMASLHGHVAYQIGVTGAGTLGAEAFAQGSGVCQDHAHIFIGMMRYLGLPARYVTGYLATAEGLTATASHAWAEVLLPDFGWVGFDAANGVCPTSYYVRVAGGIDANDVTPVRGSRKGGAHEIMTVEVSVTAVQQ